MIGKINAAVLESFKNINPKLNSLYINDNTIVYDKHSFNLETFHLESLLDSYQLKLDLANLEANELYIIIKLNAVTLLNKNLNDDYRNLINNLTFNPKIEIYMNHMQQLNKYQYYLNDEAFSILQEFIKINNNLKNLSNLNEVQKQIVNLYTQKIQNSDISQSLTFKNNDSNEGGTARKYTPNGFASSLIIVGATLMVGVFIGIILMVI